MQNIYQNVTSTIQLHDMIQLIQIRGIRQGDSLSSKLFILAMENALNDIVIITKDPQELQTMLTNLYTGSIPPNYISQLIKQNNLARREWQRIRDPHKKPSQQFVTSRQTKTRHPQNKPISKIYQRTRTTRSSTMENH